MSDVFYDWQEGNEVMRGFCLAFAVIAALLFCVQIICLQKLRAIPVYMLPLLSFCIVYENVVLYCGGDISATSSIAYSAYFFLSLQIPLFVIILFELTFRLHEARSTKFCCIPFDQSEGTFNFFN
jgi:hypothetical protein